MVAGEHVKQRGSCFPEDGGSVGSLTATNVPVWWGCQSWGRLCLCVGSEYMGTLLSVQCCCEPKISLGKKVY